MSRDVLRARLQCRIRGLKSARIDNAPIAVTLDTRADFARHLEEERRMFAETAATAQAFGVEIVDVRCQRDVR